MQPSRRQVIATIGSGASLGLVGCVAYARNGGDSDDANANDSDEQIPEPPTIEFDTDSTDEEDGDGPDDSAETPSFPTEGPLEARLVGTDVDVTLFERSDLEVGEVQAAGDVYLVPVTVSEEQSTSFLDAIQDLDLGKNYQAYEIVLTVDGEEIRRSGITTGLAHEWDNGGWARQIAIQAPTEVEAQRLRDALN